MSYHRRAFRRYEQATDTPPDAGTDADPERALDLGRATAVMDALLQGMGQAKRQAFVLYHLEQLSMGEVAEILGCPLPTAYGRVRAARRELRAAARNLGVLE